MRLPKPVYETLPLLYGLIGAAMLLEGYRLRPGPLSTPLSLLGFLGLIAAAVIWLRRRGFRATRSDYDPGSDSFR